MPSALAEAALGVAIDVGLAAMTTEWVWTPFPRSPAGRHKLLFMDALSQMALLPPTGLGKGAGHVKLNPRASDRPRRRQ
jgi:hypothetical protein